MKLGSPATHDDFYGREQVLSDLWRYLESEHIKLPGVRRLGKSSVLNKLLEESPAHGMFAQWIDLSKVHTAAEFVERLEQAYPDTHLQQFLKTSSRTMGKTLSRFKKFELNLPELAGGGGGSLELFESKQAQWNTQAATLQARLSAQGVLILLDEFPIMLQNIIKNDPSEAAQLLAWLRIWRQTAGLSRCVYTGSIGLDSLLERHGLSVSMNDCYTYALSPFTRIEAVGMWVKFSQKEGWQISEPTVQAALDKVGWLSPYFLCILLDECFKAGRTRMQETGIWQDTGGNLLEEDVNSAYEGLLALRSRFIHWETRLKESLSADELTVCLEMLRLLSRNTGGLSLKQLNLRLSKLSIDAAQREQLLQDLAAQLSDEGYLSPPNEAGKIQFLSFPLREWWSRNHV